MGDLFVVIDNHDVKNSDRLFNEYIDSAGLSSGLFLSESIA
jgi:hypothetical protein